MRYIQSQQTQVSDDLDKCWKPLTISLFSISLAFVLFFVSGNAQAVDSDLDGLDDADELSLVRSYPFGVAQNLSSTADGAYVVVEADLDGDGDLDVVSGQYIDENNGRISWFENDGFGDLTTEHIITTDTGTMPGLRSIVAADINADGHIDLVTADGGAIAWFQNDGNVNPTFSAKNIIANYLNDEILYAYSVAVGDLNGDGYIDVASAHIGIQSATFNVDDKVAWYANDGSGNFGSLQTISSIIGDSPVSVVIADVGGDSKLDVIVGSLSADKVSWFENTGGAFGPEAIITTAADGVSYLAAADINGDATIDIVSVSQNDDKVAWYPNNGGGVWGAQNVI